MPPRTIVTAGLYLSGELPEFVAGGTRSDEAQSRGSRAADREVAERERDFALLVDRHSRLMFRVAFSLLRNAQDAEDAVQETFLKLYRGDAWRRMNDEKAFLARTAWRVALHRLPKIKEQHLDSAVEPSTSERDSPEAAAMQDARAALLRRMIDVLPEDLRRVLVLSAMEELNSRETGELLDIPEGTVRTRLMRAKDELRRRYEASLGRTR